LVPSVDITYMATEEGCLFLAVVIDLFSRRGGGLEFAAARNTQRWYVHNHYHLAPPAG
jgi:transposase InsO family protein